MKELLTALLIEASQLSGLGIDPTAPLPVVEFVDRCKLTDLEAGHDVPCPDKDVAQPIAVYLDNRDRMAINRDLDRTSVQFRMILVHELVHYLQDQHGLLAKYRKQGCLAKAEKLAYKVTFAWLDKHGLDREISGVDPITLLYATSCDNRRDMRS